MSRLLASVSRRGESGKNVESVRGAADALTAEERYADSSFSDAVIHWQKQYGRHALPWQNSRDAYRVWLSEIMLQQTQVAAVIPYYQRFLQSFPDVFSLAQASSEQVMAHWSGLGYYTRARNLHACAKRIVAEYAGVFPCQPELLADLPGIGRSTAAAIAAFSYGVRAAILDGNVKRVFTRVFGISGYPSAKAVEDDLWLRAQALLPSDGIGAYTQGLMDLGATLCTRSRPECGRCPLQERCVAMASDRIADFPAKKPKKTIPVKTIAMLLVQDNQQVWLEKRPDSGIWGGLLSLPELPLQTDMVQMNLQIRQTLQHLGEVAGVLPLEKINHVFSHFKLEITPYHICLRTRHAAVSENTHVWYPIDQFADAALPAPVKKLLSQVADHYARGTNGRDVR